MWPRECFSIYIHVGAYELCSPSYVPAAMESDGHTCPPRIPPQRPVPVPELELVLVLELVLEPPFLRPLPYNGTILPHAAVAYAIWMDALGRLYTIRHTHR